MSKKIDPNREAEIRSSNYECQSDPASLAVVDLLGEIDFLRSKMIEVAMKEAQSSLKIQKQYDKLALKFLKQRFEASAKK